MPQIRSRKMQWVAGLHHPHDPIALNWIWLYCLRGNINQFGNVQSVSILEEKHYWKHDKKYEDVSLETGYHHIIWRNPVRSRPEMESRRNPMQSEVNILNCIMTLWQFWIMDLSISAFEMKLKFERWEIIYSLISYF